MPSPWLCKHAHKSNTACQVTSNVACMRMQDAHELLSGGHFMYLHVCAAGNMQEMISMLHMCSQTLTHVVKHRACAGNFSFKCNCQSPGCCRHSGSSAQSSGASSGTGVASARASVPDLLAWVNSHKITRGRPRHSLPQAGTSDSVCLVGETSGRIKWIQPSGAFALLHPEPKHTLNIQWYATDSAASTYGS